MSSVSLLASLAGSSSRAGERLYRLVNEQGAPHPVLDDLYDSLETAWNEALSWWQEHRGDSPDPVGIGIEVSTANGGWRTLRHPGS
ncbi:MAG: hypothetical protein VKO00_02160 [Cyanobacteriota bacterium]|jgi:hypothetical protein|nr:hypothetical protein [Cyanobacteriota bacterium]